MVTITISRKNISFLIATLSIFIVAGLVIAYNPGYSAGDPNIAPVHGHSPDELEGLGSGSSTGVLCPFGDYQDTDIGQASGTGAALDGDTVYQARTDGFVLAKSSAHKIQGFTDSSDASAMVTEDTPGQGYDTFFSSITMPVKRGNYWKVVAPDVGGTIEDVYWIPLDCGGSAAPGSTYGTWTTTDSTGAALEKGSIYQAECNGIISFNVDSAGPGTFIFTGNANPPTIEVAGSDAINGREAGNAPVLKDEYIKITSVDTPSVRWLPFGSCNLVKQ